MYCCPRDRHELIQRMESGHSIWCCNIGSGGFVQALASRKTIVTDASFPREEWDLEIKCPKDKRKMKSLRHKDVLLDLCPKCSGVWMDGHEIAKVLGPAYSQNAKSKNPAEWLGGVDLSGGCVESALGGIFSGP